MNDEYSIAARIVELETLNILAKAYAQISSNRMKKTRGSVLTNREFLEAIDKIFQEVRDSYRRRVMQLAKRKRNKGVEKLTFIAHNGKTVAVFLSANTGLYGDIMAKTYYKFIDEVNKGGVEATVIGRYGRTLFLGDDPNRPHTYFELPDYGTDTEKLAKIVSHLVQYEEIHIYHGKFQSLVNQQPVMFNISAETPIDLSKASEEDKQPIRFLFEPTMKQILIFFETEMFGSLFEQSVREGQLAKFAARMLAMDKASQNIQENIGKMQMERLRVSHRVANRKQLNSLASTFSFRK